MAAYEQRDNSGTIFKNDKREKDTHPHGVGKAMIGGIMYYVSAWTKEGASGKFQSLSFKPVDASQEQKPASRGAETKPTAKPAPNFSDIDQDIPF